jgi:phosphate transport system permease protein
VPDTSTPSAAAATGNAGPRFGLGRRRTRNRLTWFLCAAALVLLVIPVVWIVGGVADRALRNFHFSLLTTYPVGNIGGVLNSIEGTFVLVVGVLIVAATVGMAGGIYLAEYARDGRGQFLRGASEVLAGVPSIVLGYVGLVALVQELHWGNSLYAGIIVVSVLVVPYVIKTTEVALRTVPTSYREGGEALGMRSGYMLRKLVLRPALPGIATGLILAAAISVGETAPLLLTVGYNERAPTFSLHNSPIGFLTYNVITDYNQPSTFLHQRANVAALLLILLVLILIVVARVVVMTTQRHSPDRPQRVGKGGG